MLLKHPFLYITFVAVLLWSFEAHTEPTPEPTPELAQSGMKTAGWITIGLGAAAFCGSAVMGYLSNRKRSEATAPDASSLDEKSDTIERYDTAHNVLLIGAVVAAGTGVSLILFAPKDAPSLKVGISPEQVFFRSSF
jgi:hypothetical protein